MNIAIYTKDGLNKEMLLKELGSLMDVVLVDKNPDYVFTFGGDGTFLDAVHEYGYDPIFVPINFGTLGFYSSWAGDTIKNLKSDILNNNVIYSPTIEINMCSEDKCTFHICVNEATVINPVQTQILDVYINDYQIEHFRGTGLCVATPSGSTAYNKSLGGSIISPSKRLFQMTHIAPINNVKYRNIGNSLIFDQSEQLTFIAKNEDFANAILTIDRKTYSLRDITHVDFNLSEVTVKILVPSDNNFYRRVKRSFIGDLD